MEIKENITRTLGKGKLYAIKHSPEILLIGGIISGGLALVSAIKETLKAEEVIDEHERKMDEIEGALTLAESGEAEYTLEDAKKDKVKAYIQTGWGFAKLYAPTILFTGLSVTCILTSHGIMRKRNIALAASLATVRKAFDEYRGRVIRELGSDSDNHFLYETVEKGQEIETVDDKGKKKTKVEKYSIPTATNAFSRFFDESNPNWEKDGSANYFFIMGQMKSLQYKLINRGYLFLNEAYDALDIPITIAGQSAGWIYDDNNKDNTIIKFEGFENNEINNSPAIRALMNGYERNCLLNFENIRDDILTDLPRIDPEVSAI